MYCGCQSSDLFHSSFNLDAGNTYVLLYIGRHCVCLRKKTGTVWSNWIVQRRQDVSRRTKFTLEKKHLFLVFEKMFPSVE